MPKKRENYCLRVLKGFAMPACMSVWDNRFSDFFGTCVYLCVCVCVCVCVCFFYNADAHSPYRWLIKYGTRELVIIYVMKVNKIQ